MARTGKLTKTDKGGRRDIAPGYRRLQCFIPEALVHRLKVKAAERGLGISDAMAEAVELYTRAKRSK